MTDPDAFLLKQLIDVRVFVAFVAPASLEQGRLNDWPQVWVRDEHGQWERMLFGRQRRAHQLLCLLAWSHRDVREKVVDLYFGHGVDEHGEIVTRPMKNAARTARRTLEKRLAEQRLGDLFVVPGAGTDRQPGRVADDRGGGWRLDAALSDIELAAIAVQQGAWEAASLLTDGADGCVIGFARPARGKRALWRVRMSANARDAARLRLPRSLLASAYRVADAVRDSATAARQAPPREDRWVETMLAWLSDPAQRVAPVEDVATAATSQEEVVVDAEVIEERELPPGDASDESTAADDRPLPVPAPRGELVAPAEDSAVTDVIARSPIPDVAPATVGQLRTESELEITDGDLVVVVHPLDGRAVTPRRGLALLAGLVVALAIALVVFAVTGQRGGGQTAGEVAQHARLEQETPAHSVKTFQDPRNLTGHSIPLPPNQVVLVSCREYAQSASSNRGDYWYRLLSPRWRGRYAPADTFLNGDPGAAYSQPNAPKVKHPHNYDTAVPLCSGDHGGGSLETPRTQTTPTFASASRGTPAGPSITDRARVVISCKLASSTPTAQPGGVVYRIASPPWNDHYYVPSRAFRNTVPANSGDLQLVDIDVPTCPQ